MSVMRTRLRLSPHLSRVGSLATLFSKTKKNTYYDRNTPSPTLRTAAVPHRSRIHSTDPRAAP